MDWQAVAVNLILSAIIAILLILANWIVNIWEQRSSWGRWKQVFLRYPSVLRVYNRVQEEKTKILEKSYTVSGVLFLISIILAGVEMMVVPLVASWIDPKSMYSTLALIFLILELFLLPSILMKILFRDNTLNDYSGLRYSSYAVYISALGAILAVFNLQDSNLSALVGFLAFQILIVGLVLVVSKYLELSLFNHLWNIRVRNNVSVEFPYVKLTLKSGRLVVGRLVDFMDKSALVLKHGTEYVHVNWNEIEIIRILASKTRTNDMN